MGLPPPEPSLEPVVIRDVWASNLDSEFELISKIIAKYPFISMDTEFPGVIFKPRNQNHRNLRPVDNYRLLKANVDALNLIQVGLTFSDKHGNLPDLGTDGKNRFIWQFNFRDFNVARDLHAPDSVALLHRQGIDFARNAVAGVSSARFAELAAASGLLFNDAVTWVTFHGAYDLGYLVKVLTRRVLPIRLEEFLYVVNVLFGNKVYDVKHMLQFCNGLYGGLERVCQTLNVDRVAGKCHQAGSDSLLTWHAFQKIRDTYFAEGEHEKYANIFFGLEIRDRRLLP